MNRFTDTNRKLRISGLFLCVSLFVGAQTISEIEEMKISSLDSGHNKIASQVKGNDSEYDWFFNNLFVFYKKFVSSQDASSCSFTPSCSEYALIAIKQEGIMEGFVNFWDRFSRCNAMSPEDYPVDSRQKLLIDPVRNWRYEEK